MFVKKEPLEYKDEEVTKFSVPKAIIYAVLPKTVMRGTM